MTINDLERSQCVDNAAKPLSTQAKPVLLVPGSPETIPLLRARLPDIENEFDLLPADTDPETIKGREVRMLKVESKPSPKPADMDSVIEAYFDIPRPISPKSGNEGRRS